MQAIRSGKNGRHALVGLLRQSVFSRLAGYEAVNDAGSLRHDPAMRWIVGGKAAQGSAASPSQMGRFEAQWLVIHREFHLSGRKLNQAAPGDRQSRMASGRTLSACRLYSHQHEKPGRARLSTTSAEDASNGSRKARARSNGRGCHVGRSPRTPSVSSFMRWPIILAISCALWRRRSRSRIGR